VLEFCRMRVVNIAHRGASARYPENTLAAFRAAIEAGADMCELDVMLTRDGGAVVIHDETLERTTNGQGRVADATLAEIKRLEASGQFGAQFAGERVPTLDEVFALTHGRCALNVELKCAGAERIACELIRKYDELNTSMLSSFDWDALRRARAIEPGVRIGLLAEEKPQELLEAAAEMRAYAINAHHKLASADLCAQAHRRGLKVYVWTVDDPNQMQAKIEAGVDGIMTNYPERLAALVG
jgi:glycerophosphoryl diester phosphodiesterase